MVTINKLNDMPPNSLKDPNLSFKMKQRKKKRVRAHFLIRNTSRVEGHVEAPKWDQNKLTSESSK